MTTLTIEYLAERITFLEQELTKLKGATLNQPRSIREQWSIALQQSVEAPPTTEYSIEQLQQAMAQSLSPNELTNDLLEQRLR
ncbi:hypothetical protein [Herpetosiphon giganteus]|uniref:hypothetical protein n=1 Tax=Herpetosiphon giganteus TaxID=2029754 RepID=UPI00195E80CA|nr:hypothetical protein [Herpetosiphon giganteus]MBM7843717.1 hypothetical protein [Herpetosiphon giganteus]